MRLNGLIAAISLAGCVASPGSPDEAGGGGKADGDGTANAACTTDYVEWLLLEFKPALEAEPIDAARAGQLETLAREAPCRGELLGPTAFTTWLDTTNLVAFVPYFQQHAAASLGFMMNGSPDKGNYDTWLARTQPSEATKLAVRVMKAARAQFVIDRLAMGEWLGLYQVMAELVLHPLLDPALIADVEGYWTLNPGEAAMLDLLGETRPTGGRDGTYAAWVDAYGEILQRGVSIDSEDDYRAADSRLGCASDEAMPCGRDTFLDRFIELRPTAHGDEDSEQWMWELSLWASIAATSGSVFVENDARQLARVDSVRPMKLTGAGAYRVWLMAVADSATAANAAVYTQSVVPAKPCTSDGEAHYAAFVAEHAQLPQSIREAARPVACAN